MDRRESDRLDGVEFCLVGKSSTGLLTSLENLDLANEIAQRYLYLFALFSWFTYFLDRLIGGMVDFSLGQ